MLARWERFDATPMDRVGLEVHLRLLREHIRDGDRVLDAGAGPGRFTLELARLGATVVAGDISPRQLDLHAEMTASVDASIEARQLLDILDLGGFPDASMARSTRATSVVCTAPDRHGFGRNFLSVGNDAWDDRFLEVEIEACREPGALDGGTHILAVVERI